MATVHLPSSLRQLTNGTATAVVDGQTLAEIFEGLERQFPGIQERLSNRGELRRFFRIAVNDEVVFTKSWPEVPVSASDNVRIIAAIAGG